MTIKNYGLLLALLLLVTMAYMPMVNIPFAANGDDHKIFWIDSTHECCDSSLDTKNWYYVGRYLGSVAANVSQYNSFEMSDLSKLRLCTTGMVLLGIVLTYFLYRKLEVPDTAALFTATGTLLLPGIAQGVMNAHAGVFLVLPTILAVACGTLPALYAHSTYLSLERPGRLAYLISRIFLPTVGFIALLWTYQGTAMCFLVPAGIRVIFVEQHNRTRLASLAILGAMTATGAAIYYYVHSRLFLPGFLEHNPTFRQATENARFEFLAESGKSVLAMLQEKYEMLSIVYKRSALLFFHNNRVTPYLYTAGTLLVAGIFAAATRQAKELHGGFAAALRHQALRVLIGLAFMTATYLPNLAAVGGSVGYRVLVGMQAILLGVLVWCFLQVVALLPAKTRPALCWAVAGPLLVLALFKVQVSGMDAGLNANYLYKATRMALLPHIGKRIDGVHIVDGHSPQLSPLGHHMYEMLNSEITRGLVDVLLGELGYRYPLLYGMYNHRPGDIFLAGDNDVVLDMNALPPRRGSNFKQLWALDKILRRRSYGLLQEKECFDLLRRNAIKSPFSLDLWRTEEEGRVLASPRREESDPLGLQLAQEALVPQNGKKPFRLILPIYNSLPAGASMRMSVWAKPGPGVTEMALAVTTSDAQHQIQTCKVEPGRWQKVVASFTTTNAVESLEFFIYPAGTSAAHDPDGQWRSTQLWGACATFSQSFGGMDQNGAPLSTILRYQTEEFKSVEPDYFKLSNLFDGNTSTMWEAPLQYPASITLKNTGDSLLSIAKYTFSADTGAGALMRMPKSWKLEGSMDGVHWVELDSRTNQSNWTDFEQRSFVPTNSRQSSKFFRLTFTDGNTPGIIRMNEISFEWEKDYTSFEQE